MASTSQRGWRVLPSPILSVWPQAESRPARRQKIKGIAREASTFAGPTNGVEIPPQARHEADQRSATSARQAGVPGALGFRLNGSGPDEAESHVQHPQIDANTPTENDRSQVCAQPALCRAEAG